MYDSLVKLPWILERDAPPFEGNDIKFPESLARYVVENYSKKGARILDPFAGLGTTLFVAEELARVPFGFETNSLKHEWVAGQLENWTHHIHDDSANIARYQLPKIDLLLTSPPYMPRHHQYNPLFGGDPKQAGYERYLKRLAVIFRRIAPVLKANAPVIVQADNLQHGRIFTPLVHDVARAMSKDYLQTGQTTIIWENAKPDYPMTQLLLFKKK